MPNIKDRLLPHYHTANRWSKGSLDIVRVAIKNFGLARGGEAAASLAYYALFSLFPLLLVLIAVLGFILKSGQAYEVVLDFITTVLPNSRGVTRVIFRKSQPRGTIGLFGLVGAFWSASDSSTRWCAISIAPGWAQTGRYHPTGCWRWP